MKRLQFNMLWLVSESERAARKIEFRSNKTLLVGRNHTGKSTILKHLFWTLGCEIRGQNDRWDSLSIAVLEFKIDDSSYIAYRRANVFAIKNTEAQDSKIYVTANYKEWSEAVSKIFDFRLMLPTHQDTLAQATPPYLFLPFYMDQDGSWLQQWNSFSKLTQFSNWKKPLVSYVTGQRPNGYYIAKFEETKARSALNELTQELSVVQTALSRVNKTLPRPVVQLDKNAFKYEIADLLRTSTALKSEQESLRKKAFSLASQKEALLSQISMAREALRDLEGDLKYLTEKRTEPTIICPTCGTTHESGFPVRLQLIDDSETLRKVLAELEVEHSEINEKLASIQGNISRAKLKISEIEKILQTKKGLLRLKDIVNSQSAEVIQGAFHKDISALKDKISKQETAVSKIKEKVNLYDSSLRTKAINEFYSEKIELFASELGVQDLRAEVKRKPDANLAASGSALPRSLLAYQYAVLHTAKEKGDAHLFPVVVDSPNQQGQDTEHLLQMLNFISRRTPERQQLILAVEEMPNNFVFNGEIINLTTPYGLLDRREYNVAINYLRPLVDEVAAGIDEALTKKRNDMQAAIDFQNDEETD